MNRLLLAGAAAIATVLVGAVPALAGPRPAGPGVYQPDGWVRYHSFHSGFGDYVDPTAWKGDDIYNSTGKYQTAKQQAIGTYEPGDYYVFQVTFQNDGSTDRFQVTATGTGNWTVKYYVGKTNVTDAITGGIFLTKQLNHGETQRLKVKVWIGDVGTSMERLLAITSLSDSAKSDTVRIKASYSSCGC
jgi:hypothetical protein